MSSLPDGAWARAVLTGLPFYLWTADANGTLTYVDPRLLEILVCPVTHGPLVYDREAGELISQGAKLAYPIRDGVPIMLPEEARTID